MIGRVTFEGRVEPLISEGPHHTFSRLPGPVVHALGKARRVEGEIAEHPVNLALPRASRAPVLDGVFRWAGQTLLNCIGTFPGESVEVRLRPAPDDRVELDPDVEGALRSAGVLHR